MEPEVVIAAMIGGVAFLVIVFFVWRAQNASGEARGNEGTMEDSKAVVTASLETGHTPAPLVLSYTADEIENPTEADIVSALTLLESNLDDTVMLDDADATESYLQAYMDSDGAYCVEYHDGNNNRHYRADPNLNLPLTQTLFFTFNRRDWDGIKRTVGWRDTTNEY